MEDNMEYKSPNCADLATKEQLLVTESKQEMDKVPFWTSSRMGMAFMAFLGFILQFAFRLNMSVAIVCMVNHTAIIPASEEYLNTTTFNRSLVVERCTEQEHNTTQIYESQEGNFVWDKQLQGVILGSFFWGYVASQTPGGWLASRFGGKPVFGLCILVCAMATLLCPVAARSSVYFLVALRVVIGLAQGGIWTSVHHLLAQWAPPLERSKLGGFISAGNSLGCVVTMPIFGLLCEYGFDGGWASIFYISGIAGLLWFVAWMFTVYENPGVHPRISVYEREYIQQSLRGHVSKTTNKKVKIPWLDFAGSPAVWALLVTHVCSNWGAYTFMTQIPSYMREVLKFDIQSNGFFSAVPYLGLCIFVNISANVADMLRARKILTTTATRKLFNSLGHFIPAIMCFTIGLVDCTNSYMGVVILTIGISFIGCVEGAGYIVNHLDIAPRYAGILFGITGTIATIPGVIAPYIVSVLTENQTQEEWLVVFYICGITYIFGAVIFIIFGSGELQDWARDPEHLQYETEVGKGAEKLFINHTDENIA